MLHILEDYFIGLWTLVYRELYDIDNKRLRRKEIIVVVVTNEYKYTVGPLFIYKGLG